MDFLKKGLSKLNKIFNPEARDYDEVMSLRGNQSPEANDRLVEIITQNFQKLVQQNDKKGISVNEVLAGYNRLAVASMGLSTLLDNGPEGVKRFGEIATESGSPLDFLTALRVEYDRHLGRVPTPDVKEIAETLVSQLKDQISASDPSNPFESKKRVGIVSELAYQGLVSAEVSNDFREFSVMDLQRKSQSEASPSALEHP